MNKKIQNEIQKTYSLLSKLRHGIEALSMAKDARELLERKLTTLNNQLCKVEYEYNMELMQQDWDISESNLWSDK